MDIIAIKTDGLSFAEVEGFLPCVSAGRRKAILKKSVETDKVQSLIAGLLLRSEISRCIGIPENKLSFVKGPLGKPYVKGGGVQFSVSHTKGAVCVAIGNDADGEIGVDIECRTRCASDKLKERVLSKGERDIVHTDEDFIRVWVKKEAFLKRTGIGVATDLKGADTSILPDTFEFSCGDYYIGVSGKGAAEANITELSVNELLSRFVMVN